MQGRRGGESPALMSLTPGPGSLAETVTPPLERGTNLNELRWGRQLRVMIIIHVVLSLCLSVFAWCPIFFVSQVSPVEFSTPVSPCWYFYTGHHTKLQHL